MPRNFVSILLLIAVILAAIWLLDSPLPQFQSQAEPDPDALTLVQFFDNMHTLQFDQAGVLQQDFFAQRVEHRRILTDTEGSGKAYLEAPHIVFYEEGAAIWNVKADKGQTELVNPTDNPLFLQHNVTLEQSGNEDPAQILTDSLWVNPDSKRIYTDALVELRAPGLVSTGRGLEANVEQEVITILGETKTRYEKTDN